MAPWMRYHPFIGILVLMVAVGCEAPLQPEFERELSVIIWDAPASDTGLRVTAPEKVQAGETFSFRFRTYSGRCEEGAGTDVISDSAKIEVLPYTRPKPSDICQDVLVAVYRTVELSFAQAGEAVVVLHGRARPNDFDAVTVPVAITVE